VNVEKFTEEEIREWQRRGKLGQKQTERGFSSSFFLTTPNYQYSTVTGKTTQNGERKKD
jgi:outer membrane biogenesis lipoprotein LolB